MVLIQPQEDIVYSSDDENLSFPLSKLSKDDLIIKVKMLEVQNKDLRSTIAKQRVMIDISECKYEHWFIRGFIWCTYYIIKCCYSHICWTYFNIIHTWLYYNLFSLLHIYYIYTFYFCIAFPRIHELSNLVLKNLESITEKQKISISVSPLKARTNISLISKVSKVTSKNVVKDVSKADNVDFCNQMQPELLSNQPHNILEVCKLYV